jgi:hypothetical protein
MRTLQIIIGGFLMAGGSVLFFFSLASTPAIIRVFHSSGPAAVLIAMGLASFIGGLYLVVQRNALAGPN